MPGRPEFGWVCTWTLGAPAVVFSSWLSVSPSSVQSYWGHTGAIDAGSGTWAAFKNFANAV
ncbi:hypothetical protein OG588_28775 [Streptomyces prunicolor]|uniref:hypothetical protein n=1 Tax=Streptomyces prunicolor TaxID=67348 RepID=UPI0038654692|nr:hypothetical protein OG588_28775 [Streptomyces prunicolor]